MKISSIQIRKLIRESNLIEGITGEKEIDQSIVAWYYLMDLLMPLTHQAVRKTQKIITINQANLSPGERGYYRDMAQVNVRVGTYFPPDYSQVAQLMDSWLKQYEDLGPWEAHKRFEAIHPFADGNGRTGRMLMWWHEIREGLEPTLIRAKDRQDYYDKLSASRV